MSSKILTALFIVGGASALYAGPVYSCGGGSACDGNLYAVWVSSQTASSYVLNVGIQVTQNYLAANGGPGTEFDHIDAISVIPDNNKTMTSATLTGVPAGGIWAYQTGGLNAGGCSGNGAGFICAGSSNRGTTLFDSGVGKNLIWQFTVQGTPPSLGDTAHIKYHFIDYNGNKVGDLGSFDVTIQCIGGNGCAAPPTSAPEPVTSALIGSGLIGLYFLRRRLPGSR